MEQLTTMDYVTLATLLVITVILTNIVVEVIKSFAGLNDKPTKLVTFIVALVLTELMAFLVCMYYQITITWLVPIISIVLGFVVSYGAMFGFDNLYGELLDKLKSLFTKE